MGIVIRGCPAETDHGIFFFELAIATPAVTTRPGKKAALPYIISSCRVRGYLLSVGLHDDGDDEADQRSQKH
jgi:hypothetical protein